MKCVLVFAGVLFLSLAAVAQGADPARAGNQARMDSLNHRLQGKALPVEEGNSTQLGSRTIDLMDFQNKTTELNGLVQSVNRDMKNLRSGILPADLTQRLKRIEKLAKDLRHTLE